MLTLEPTPPALRPACVVDRAACDPGRGRRAATALLVVVERLRGAVARRRRRRPDLDLDGDEALVIDLLAPPPVVVVRGTEGADPTAPSAAPSTAPSDTPTRSTR